MRVNDQIKIPTTFVEIFRTNVEDHQMANKIIAHFNHYYPDYRVNFDLDDCDNVLRIECSNSIDVVGVLSYAEINQIEMEVIS